MNQVTDSKALVLWYSLVMIMELFKEYSPLFIPGAQNVVYFVCLSTTVIIAVTADICFTVMCQALCIFF